MVDETRVHSARRYNYWLGGKDNFAVDRESGDLIAKNFPTIRITAVENRGFLRRAVTYLAAEAGIRQFLDVGTGLPTANNTHEVAQRITPDAKIVYVDNDPMVLVHARALLTSTPEGRTAYIEADLRDPEKILADPALREVLDLGQPVAVMLIAVLHFIQDTAEAARIVRTLLDALPVGSYVAISNGTADYADEETRARFAALMARGQLDAFVRTAAEVGVLVEGLEVLEPGIVPVSEWRAEGEPEPRPAPSEVAVYGVVARKS
ncbi:SAM-dependent methyltransferase [Paractinoplanes lichenicola]|uniref:SAM-dependent methyltransferase n=1 Tax=Paractinoplanes lichenicola TaxID=2802976 RepID=A0ABS1VRG5_9ACTN|nr:SAM-dependent methyltransferase [Actinoplanes lichenicola]MBL7257270.1 SAM-dependent methyltransferase [Actinoplanes lichenicola]